MRYFIILILAILPHCASAATLTWQAPTQNTDGTPITGTLTYRVYCAPEGGEFTFMDSTQATTITLDPCANRSRWRVTAFGARESAPSNVVYLAIGEPDTDGTPLPPVVASDPAPTCTPCPTCNAEPEWRVQPWRDATTRPVYSAQNFAATPSNQRIEIGRVTVGTLCGEFIAPYSETITTLEWRRVTATNMEDGAAVCERTHPAQ